MDLKRRINMFCKTFSVMFCFVEMYLLLFPMFMLAWASGTYECMLQINNYGEADIEMVLWAVSFPIVIYGAYLNLYSAFTGVNT